MTSACDARSLDCPKVISPLIIQYPKKSLELDNSTKLSVSGYFVSAVKMVSQCSDISCDLASALTSTLRACRVIWGVGVRFASTGFFHVLFCSGLQPCKNHAMWSDHDLILTETLECTVMLNKTIAHAHQSSEFLILLRVIIVCLGKFNSIQFFFLEFALVWNTSNLVGAR